MTNADNALAPSAPRHGAHGRVLHVDLTQRKTWVEPVGEDVYRQFLGGYGLGAWLMWKHFAPGTDALAPEACFAICSGLLTGVRTPFSGSSPGRGSVVNTNRSGKLWMRANSRTLSPRGVLQWYTESAFVFSVHDQIAGWSRR